MRLTIKNIHYYLLDKGFIDMASLVNGGYMVTQSQTRNSIFKISRRNAKNLFVKQLISFDPNNTYVLQKDATCLWLIKNDDAFQKLSGYVPDYFGFDAEKQVLVTECLADSINLEDHCRINRALSNDLIEQMADILNSYHFVMTDELRSSPSVQFFPKQIPWILNIGDVDAATISHAAFSQTPGANPVLEAVIASPEFKKLFAGIRNNWEYSTLIHGDIKWMNMLLHVENGHEKIKIIDWEIADVGDPLWDVAGIFQGLVSNTLLYNIGQNNAAEIGLDDIKEVWPLVDFFWQLYSEKRAAGNKLSREHLVRSIQYTGVRLIQTAIEQNMMMQTLQPNAIKLLQASFLILSNIQQIINKVSSPKKLQYA